MRKLLIAIDFDGTIVEDCYPGPPVKFIYGAKEALLHLERCGHAMFLWTLRSGTMLDDATEFLINNGIRISTMLMSKQDAWIKPPVDVFIDDRNIGGFVGWQRVVDEIYGLSKRKSLEVMGDLND